MKRLMKLAKQMFTKQGVQLATEEEADKVLLESIRMLQTGQVKIIRMPDEEIEKIKEGQ